MPSHSCDTCGKVFKQKGHLLKHLQNKKGCSADKQTPFVCGCGKQYSHLAGLSRHRKTCSGSNATSLQDENAALRRQVTLLQQQLVSPSVVNNVTNNITNQGNVTNNTVNITLNNFGHESQEHLEALSYADLKKILKLTPDHESLIRMITFIHLNEAVPENRTIKLDDKDSNVICVFKRGRWREQNADTVLYDLICRNRLRFVDLEEVLTKNMSKSKFEELTQYLCKAEDMANSENADLHVEYAFKDLMTLIRDKVAA